MTLREFLIQAVIPVAVIVALSLCLGFFIKAVGESEKQNVATTRQWKESHDCRRSHYTDGAIVYQCSNGVWTEGDIYRETR